MTSGTVVGAALVLFGALVLALSVVALARGNPTESIPYPGNRGWRLYLVAYLIAFPTALLGSFQLRDEHGWGLCFAGFAVFFLPFASICWAHGARARVRRASAPGPQRV